MTDPVLTTAPPRPPLRRPPRPARVVGGVCAGLAVHLGQPVARIRLIMAAACLVSGAGALVYLLLWLSVPAGDPWQEAVASQAPERARLAGRLRSADGGISHRRIILAASVGLLGAAIVLAAWSSGEIHLPTGILAALLVAGGAALVWSQIEAVARDARQPTTLTVMGAGLALVAAGMVTLIAWRLGPEASALTLARIVMAAVLLAAGLAVVLAPVVLRLVESATSARQAQARADERADIAAHLHDSVLQTLLLIRKQAADPQAVARLARTQERELRAWLYTDRPASGISLAQQIRQAVDQAETRYGVEADVVIVADREPDPASQALVAATGEAVANAMRHGAAPISVYAELGQARTDVYVRDRGPGFSLEDLADVPADRHGVRESILGRMHRVGGKATWRRLAHGTEVHLSLVASDASGDDGGAPARLGAGTDAGVTADHEAPAGEGAPTREAARAGHEAPADEGGQSDRACLS